MNYISFQEDKISIFSPNKPTKALLLTYHPFQIMEVDNPKLNHPDMNFEALLGLQIINDVPFLIVVSEAEVVCTLRGSNIYQIKKIDWIPVIVPSQAEEVLIQCEETYKEISKLFDEGFHYFSDHYQLNLPFHLNEFQEISKEQSKFYEQFVWNKKIKKPQKSSVIQNWCKSIIQGYVSTFTTILPSHQPLSYYIISRRSNLKAGTRYYSRGIDDEGHVANFTETQQIILYEDFMCSNVQIRGSVPAFFEQVGINGISGQFKIGRNEAMTEKAFNLHFENLEKIYKKIFCVNLLSIKKTDEEKLTSFFQSMVSKYAPPYVKYEYFDFHDECKNNEFENSFKLVQKIKEVVSSFGFTVINKKTKELHNLQNGVVRTNCMDCLDRTNYIQSRLALLIFQQIISNFSHFQFRQKLKEFELFVNKHEESSPLLKSFNALWADNGDSISLHYTGIGSTHTDITKNGKRTFSGTVNHKMRSLMRFFTQFTDTKKHEAINKLVKASSFRTTLLEPTQLDFMNVAIFSYKLRKQEKMTKNLRFSPDYIAKRSPAIVVVFGFIDSSHSWFKNILPFSKNDEIKQFIEKAAGPIKKLGYEIIDMVQNDQSCLMVFGKNQLIKFFSQIKHENVSKGKEIVLISKFNIHKSPMVFTGMRCSNFDHFKELLDKSHDQAFQGNKLGQARSSSILTHNYRTVVGNIASKIDFSDEYLREIDNQLLWMKNKGDNHGRSRIITEILDKDEFSRGVHHEKTKYLRNYLEGPIDFVPESNRIIFWNMENLIIKVIEYGKNKDEGCTYGEYSYEILKVHDE